ncbi:hypothetical protein KP509_17G062200 [Ceratopteris richardii]|uniref:Uncharacterized protein n=1 Tax=Ceratopteris richardii TaxID=49495 RepID=A0A8T2SYS4_CERRI|nr:hypothetical protein KP509_17G062200 [Ceratopteris richardii]
MQDMTSRDCLIQRGTEQRERSGQLTCLPLQTFFCVRSFVKTKLQYALVLRRIACSFYGKAIVDDVSRVICRPEKVKSIVDGTSRVIVADILHNGKTQMPTM